MRELSLRISAILRRGKAPVESEASIEFGVLRIDREAHRVWVEAAEIELTALEFRLLVTLYDRRNRVQSRSALLDDVWGIQADITTRTVDTHVKRSAREARSCARLRRDGGAASAIASSARRKRRRLEARHFALVCSLLALGVVVVAALLVNVGGAANARSAPDEQPRA